MQGYFITREKAIKFGLLKNPTISKELQKTIVVITERDMSEYKQNLHISESMYFDMANWFYKYYYDNLIQTFSNFQNEKNEKRK